MRMRVKARLWGQGKRKRQGVKKQSSRDKLDYANIQIEKYAPIYLPTTPTPIPTTTAAAHPEELLYRHFQANPLKGAVSLNTEELYTKLQQPTC